jgi:hypothetical protein
MIYKLDSDDRLYFQSLHETGMGYQIIIASLSHEFKLRKYVVYNSELVIDLDTNFQFNKTRIKTVGYTALLSQVETIIFKLNTITVVDKSVLKDKSVLLKETINLYNRKIGENKAFNGALEFCSINETYVRISPFDVDCRIDEEKGKLLPGSFTTTLNDFITCIGTNDFPFDRYVLPLTEKLKWVYYIKGHKSDLMQTGIFQPAFNQMGGGVEVYFNYGTFEKTLLEKLAFE